MERVNKVLQHWDYKRYVEKIELHESSRVFCRHDKKHFLDVARISYILYLEEMSEKGYKHYHNKEIKELLYAAGVLHDIGRFKEYEEGQEHHLASAQLAEPLLRDCDFSEEEIKEILTMIVSHRDSRTQLEGTLAGLFYRADKQSRECFWCRAEKECNWQKEKKNKICLQ